ncbi:MAG: tRNA pseudouridine(38-40) synthase TruA [Bacteroidetes bacterium]|nr:tRNA pseudouridine(38-40) synthase TruA [Bacteroidota bacterium]
MSRYFLHFAYNGKNYHGWQLQDNAPTIQAVLNKNLSLFFRTEIELCGAGRTDTGVHAKDYYAHFDLHTPLNNDDIPLLVHKLNGFLNEDIVIYNIIPVKDHAHARFDAISRTYNYYISFKKDIFNFDNCYTIYGSLNIDLMNEAASLLMDYTDFSSFSKSNTQTKTNNCKIYSAFWLHEEDKLIFSITADRFLRNMVRAIVGTLLEIGFNKISLDDFKQIIESKNRSEAGWSVPAKALFLTEIKYPDNIFEI